MIVGPVGRSRARATSSMDKCGWWKKSRYPSWLWGGYGCERCVTTHARKTKLQPACTSYVRARCSATHDRLHALLNNLAHHVKILILELHGQPAVHGGLNDLLRLLQVLGHGPIGPVAEVAGVLLRPENAKLHAMGVCLLQERVNLRIGHINKVELDGVAHWPHLRELLRDVDVWDLVQLGLDLLVPAVIDVDPLLKGQNLRADNCGTELGHAQGVVWGDLLRLDGLKDLVRGPQSVLLVETLVSAGVHNQLRGQVVVVRERKPALSRVEHLV
mmetsp:Transcript_16537/g.35950  ORF Transcript_16537/g.35950 Transcript_16537/m.35950 type:complete len:273 (+) Transcript_16537:283-1101(+)